MDRIRPEMAFIAYRVRFQRRFLRRPSSRQWPVERPKARGPAYDLALDAALEAINRCKADNQNISVQVTDAANEIVVLISPNAAGMRSLRLLRGKAVTPQYDGLAQLRRLRPCSHRPGDRGPHRGRCGGGISGLGPGHLGYRHDRRDYRFGQ